MTLQEKHVPVEPRQHDAPGAQYGDGLFAVGVLIGVSALNVDAIRAGMAGNCSGLGHGA